MRKWWEAGGLLLAVSAAATPAAGGGAAYKVYFVAADQPPQATLKAVTRRAAGGDTASLARQAMQSLCDGPAPVKSEAELGSRVPGGCRALGARLEGSTLHLEMSQAWDEVWGFHTSGVFAQQVIRTLSQWPEVEQVWFYVDGVKQERLGRDGFTLPLYLPTEPCELIEVIE